MQPASRREHGVDPPRFIECRRDPELEIRRRWLGRDVVLATVFAVAWDAFLLFGRRHLEVGPGELAVVVAFGVALTYYGAAGWVNRTHIRAGRGAVTVHHGPLPLLPARTVPISVRGRLTSPGVVLGRRRSSAYAAYACGRRLPAS